MRVSNVRWLALAVALTPAVGGCQTERQSIPLISAQAAAELPASQLPRVFKDPNPVCALPLQHSRNRRVEPQSRRLREMGLHRPRQPMTPRDFYA